MTIPFKIMSARTIVKMKARLKEATEVQLTLFPQPIKVKNIEVEFRNTEDGELMVSDLTIKYVHPADDDLYPLILLARDGWQNTWLVNVVKEMRDRASAGFGPQVGSPLKILDETLDFTVVQA